MRNFKIILILSFFVLAAQVSFAQTTKVYKSKDKITGKVNVLTVTENADKSISVKRSTEKATEDSEVTLYLMSGLNDETVYWVIPFKEGAAKQAEGGVSFDCHCDKKLSEKTIDNCTESFHIVSRKAYCENIKGESCTMDFTINSIIYTNKSGYLTIEASKVTIE